MQGAMIDTGVLSLLGLSTWLLMGSGEGVDGPGLDMKRAARA